MGGGNTDGGMCGGTNGGTGVTKATRHRGDGGSVLGAFFWVPAPAANALINIIGFKLVISCTPNLGPFQCLCTRP
jgi:hypothetical protein